MIFTARNLHVDFQNLHLVPGCSPSNLHLVRVFSSQPRSITAYNHVCFPHPWCPPFCRRWGLLRVLTKEKRAILEDSIL